MTKGIVTCNLIRRIGRPSVNAERNGYFVSGDEVEIKEVLLGETENDYYEGTPSWYKLTNGTFIWSGGVSLNLNDPLFLKKLELDKKVAEPGVLKKYNPNDFWWIKDYGIDKIWEMGITGKGVKIAILDQGVQISHNDLNINKEHFIDIVKQPDNTNAFIDHLDHGTHIYGLIAASNNGFGIKGISYDSEIFFANIFDFSSGYSQRNLAKAIDWAVKKEVDIISISQGSDEESEELLVSLKNAIKSGILVVCASGNLSESYRCVQFPAQYSQELEILSIGAIDKEQQKYQRTMEKGEISIYCPGVDLLSCDRDLTKGYSSKSGTSQAAPFFAAVAALGLQNARAKGKTITGIEVGNSILEYAESKPFGKIINPLYLIRNNEII